MSKCKPLEDFNAEVVLERLHGFQRDAVDYAFERLFQTGTSRRFLVADEVGLGKTLIARGVLAKALEHLLGKVPRIDIVYICSNLAIAAQNISRLNPVPGLEFSDAERITLLPLHLSQLYESRVNFVAFTPGTSLDLGNSMGTARERLLLHRLLKRHWNLSGKAPLNVLQGAVQNARRFRERAADFERDEVVSEELAVAFFSELDKRPELRNEFDQLCATFARSDARISEEDKRKRREFVGTMRDLLASTCIQALEPDLIILDEFQRFKDLLDPTTDQGELAHQLFSWSKGSARAHVLLLSATPYKAYTLQHESAEDDHYADFLRTVRFLDDHESSTRQFEEKLKAYRQAILRIREAGEQGIDELKEGIEGHLRKVMSRTERLAAGAAAHGMVRTSTIEPLRVNAADIDAYGALQRLADLLEVGDSMEYWKSAAYPLNFMEGYELRRALEDHPAGMSDPRIASALTDAARCSLPFEALLNYRRLDNLTNAKVREFHDDLDRSGAFGLLWIPPSLPYYTLSGAFLNAEGLTKRLVFSAWHLVPRCLATLLSYECERRAFSADEEQPQNTGDARRARRGLLRVSETDGRLPGLPAMTLMYPCAVLAKHCDPRVFVRETGNAKPAALDVFQWATRRVGEVLPSGLEFAGPGEGSDERWYWALPLLLDAKEEPELREWWSNADLAGRWSRTGDDEGDDSHGATEEGWLKHVEAARQVAIGDGAPTGKAPADLVDVLALSALAGPATCALRSLMSLFELERPGKAVRDAAAQIGAGFRSLYNRQESMAIVRRGRREQAYWRLALEYGFEGCISAVLDEYLHVLRDARGLSAIGAKEASLKLASAVIDAVSVRTASLRVDDPRVSVNRGKADFSRQAMRALFAMRFGSDKTDEADQVQRDTSVGTAFNSPFWPFVLATTSVGQEGLDFHWYCHTIVHWNLPSNPVDLEQREGRVHRFKGHAIRKNVARRHGEQALRSVQGDLWAGMFKAAEADAKPGDKGLVPYWLYPLSDGAWIERQVPLYPLSRDEQRYQALQRSLGAYRMVFGQPRQDELLAYLLGQIDPSEIEQWSARLRVDLSPPVRRTTRS